MAATSTQRIGGSFPQTLEWISATAPDAVIVDGQLIGATPGQSLGAVRVQAVQIQPNLTEQWSIVGWTISALLTFLAVAPPSQGLVGAFGRFGDLWGGLLVDNSLTEFNPPDTSQPVVFPSDLSTFAKIWDGQSEPIAQQPLSPTAVNLAACTPIGLTYMLPIPIDIHSGSNVSMCLILTPSLIAGVQLAIVQATYTLIYTT